MLVDSVEDLGHSPLLPILDGDASARCESEYVKLSLILPMLPLTSIATDSFELLEYFVGILRGVRSFLFTLTSSLRLLIVCVGLLLSFVIPYAFEDYGTKGLVDTRIVKIRIPKDIADVSERVACLLIAEQVVESRGMGKGSVLRDRRILALLLAIGKVGWIVEAGYRGSRLRAWSYNPSVKGC